MEYGDRAPTFLHSTTRRTPIGSTEDNNGGGIGMVDRPVLPPSRRSTEEASATVEDVAGTSELDTAATAAAVTTRPGLMLDHRMTTAAARLTIVDWDRTCWDLCWDLTPWDHVDPQDPGTRHQKGLGGYPV